MGSDAWFKVLEEQWVLYGAKLEAGFCFSISEASLGVPSDRAPEDEDGSVGWTCRIDAPSVHFSRGASDDVELAIVAQFNAIDTLSR